MHACVNARMFIHACIRACVRVCVCVHTYRNQDNIPKKCMGACRMKLTVSDKPLRHGLELLLFLVQIQRSICYCVSPYTSPYRRVFSNSCLQLIVKGPVRSLLRSALIHCPLVVCNQHNRIAQMMTMTWIKSECIVTVFALALYLRISPSSCSSCCCCVYH